MKNKSYDVSCGYKITCETVVMPYRIKHLIKSIPKGKWNFKS